MLLADLFARLQARNNPSTSELIKLWAICSMDATQQKKTNYWYLQQCGQTSTALNKNKSDKGMHSMMPFMHNSRKSKTIYRNRKHISI